MYGCNLSYLYLSVRSLVDGKRLGHEAAAHGADDHGPGVAHVGDEHRAAAEEHADGRRSGESVVEALVRMHLNVCSVRLCVQYIKYWY